VGRGWSQKLHGLGVAVGLGRRDVGRREGEASRRDVAAHDAADPFCFADSMFEHYLLQKFE
jgi:hypothetical protein